MLGAPPATSSPTPNAAIPPNSGPSGPRRSLHSPASAIANRLAVKKAEKAKAYSPMPSRARAARGIAVFTALASKATTETTEMIPKVSARWSRPRIPAPSCASPGGAEGVGWVVVAAMVPVVVAAVVAVAESGAGAVWGSIPIPPVPGSGSASVPGSGSAPRGRSAVIGPA